MKRLKIIAIGICSILLVCITVGFVYLPSVFDAKYTGPTLKTTDGKELITLIRLPEGKGPFPTLVVRSPYELPHTPLSGMPSADYTDIKDADLPKVGWEPVIEAGYALVIQHTRGRVGSEGVALDLKDRDDAAQLIRWIREQSWSNGKVGTTGDSIEAILAMMANSSNPELVDASYVQIGTPNLVEDVMLGPGGALKLELFLPWAAEQILTADQNHYDEMGYGAIKRRTSIIEMGLKIREIFSDLENPSRVAAWKEWSFLDYPVFSDATDAWNEMLLARPGGAIADYFNASETSVPTYYVAAWYDVFSPSQISSFQAGEGKNKDQRLLILNGTHFTPEDPEAWPIQPMLPWFDYHLKGDKSALSNLPRVIFPIANGNDEWYGADTWPPKVSDKTVWSLGADGELAGGESKTIKPGIRGYTYNPEDPVPTVGGRNLLITNGTLDQSSVREAVRNDVLSYDSDTLEAEIVVAGHVIGHLSVSSDVPDTDFTMKIMDTAPDGSSILVSEGIQRARFRNGLKTEAFLANGKTYDLQIDLGHIAWRFKPGHRISVDISSSNFPQWDRNLNNGKPLFRSAEVQVARNEIHHGGKVSTYVELPVLSNVSELKRLENLTTSLNQQNETL